MIARAVRIFPSFLTLVSALPVFSDTFVFTNRAEWENAAGSVTSRTFSGYSDTAEGISSGGVNLVGRYWGSHVIGDYHNPGDWFGDNPYYEFSFDTYWLITTSAGVSLPRAEYSNTKRVGLCSQYPCPYDLKNFHQSLQVTFTEPIYAFGADFTDFYKDSGFLLQPIGGITNQPTASGQTVFWGIVSSDPLPGMTFTPNLSYASEYNTTYSGFNSLILNNIAATDISVTSIPEPESVALLMPVLGILVVRSRRRAMTETVRL